MAELALPKGWTAIGEPQPVEAAGLSLPKGWTAVGEPQPITPAENAPARVNRYSLPALLGMGGEAAQNQSISDMKDIGRGAALGVTGFAELVPPLHERAAGWSRYLQSGVKDPKLATLGKLGEEGLEFAALGGPAGKLAKYAIKEAPEAVGWASRMLRAGGRGALTGGGFGALSGFQTPTGNPDFEKSLKEKGSAAIEQGGWGAALGTGLGVLGSGAKSAYGLLSRSGGKELEKSAEALRGEFSGQVGGAHTAEETKTAEALKRASAMSTDAAQIRAQGHGARLEEAERAAEALSKDLAQSPRMDRVALGEKVQKLTDALVTRLEETRSRDSGFAEAVESAGRDANVRTGKVRAAIKQMEQDLRNPEQRSVLGQIKQELTSPDTTPVAGAEGGATAKEVAALNLRSVDSLRKYLNSRLNRLNISVEQGGLGSDKDLKKHLESLRAILMEEAGNTHPAYREALEKYAKLSRPLDELTGKGALGGTTKEMQFGDDFQMEQGAVLTRLFSKTREGSEVLHQLMQEDPSIKDSIRLFLNRELHGVEGAAKPINATKLTEFLDKNEELLKRTGLFDEFKATHQKLSGSEAAIEKLRTQHAEAETTTKELQTGATQAEREAQTAKKLSEDYAKEWSALTDANTTPRKAAEAVSSLTKRLRTDGHLTPEQERQFDERARQILAEYSNRDAALKLLKALAIAAGTAGAAYAGIRGSEAISGVNVLFPHQGRH